MCVFGIAGYANDYSKIFNDCSNIAAADTNYNESNSGGCYSYAQWHDSYCEIYNHCISH